LTSVSITIFDSIYDLETCVVREKDRYIIRHKRHGFLTTILVEVEGTERDLLRRSDRDAIVINLEGRSGIE
jgi:hypothetical protein